MSIFLGLQTMVDFKKLLNKTAAEKEADHEAMINKAVQLENKELDDIKVMQDKVLVMMTNIDLFKDKNFKFVHDLEYTSHTYDTFGRKGGNLIALSEKQKSYFNALYAMTQKKQDPIVEDESKTIKISKIAKKIIKF